MLIGFGVLVLYTMLTTRSAVHILSQIPMAESFHRVFESGQPDILLKLKPEEFSGLSNELVTVRNSLNQFDMIRAPRLIYRTPEADHWYELTPGNQGRFNQRALTNTEEIGIVRQAQESFREDREPTPSTAIDRGDNLYLLLNLSRPIDKNTYFLIFHIKKSGITAIFRQYIQQFLGFFLIFLVVSTWLGKFFASKIVNPIRKISEKAQSIAYGDYGKRLNLKRSDEIGMLAHAIDVMSEKVENNLSEIERHLETMSTMNQIDKAVLSSISRNDLMHRVVGIVSSLFKDVDITILLENREKKGMDILAYGKLKTLETMFNRPFVSHDDLKCLYRSHSPEEIFSLIHTGQHADFCEKLHDWTGLSIGSLLNVPLQMNDVFCGAILLTRKTQKPFEEFEMARARMLADQVTVALQSVRAFEEKESLLFGIMLALTRSIDAKSKWTGGHSERVAIYTEQLGLALKLNETEIRQLTISAILHDVGKIAVPEAILDKPARLTEEEFAVIKQHPVVGANIIGEIANYRDIRPGILYHHEHWDGSGYPDGISGAQIPLHSRIITIADVFDAIIDDRPYRKGMDYPTAIEFMQNQKGKLFDPELAEIFIQNAEQITFRKDKSLLREY